MYAKKDLKKMKNAELVAAVLDIQSKVEDPEGLLELANESIAKLEQENEALVSEKEALEAKIDSLKNEVLEMEGVITELNAVNAKGTASNSNNNILLLAGKKYELKVKKFIWKEVEYTAANITPEVAEELIERGSSVIRLA